MPRKLSDSVVIITGASSGIGRATALRFADDGAKVVVAARRQDALEDLAREIEQRGGKASPYGLDVTKEDEVHALARYARDTYGRIDVWVNNAAVTLFGRFEEIPPEAFRRVLDTNFFGYVHGARAVLPYFREQGRGTLINVSSIVGEVGQPYTSPYVASKWAIRGFSESLRMELSLDEAPEINVCTVLPATIDTPLFQQAANYSGRAPKAMRPVYDAERVAATIVRMAKSAKREAYVGAVGPMLHWQHQLAPSMVEFSMARQVQMDHFQERPAEPTSGNLWEPMPGWAQVSGDWKTPSQTAPAVFALPAIATAIAGTAGWLFVRARQRRRQTRLEQARRQAEAAAKPVQRQLKQARRQFEEVARPVQKQVNRGAAAAREPARRAVETVRQTVGV